MSEKRQRKTVYITWKTLWILAWIGILVIVVPILAYFGMIFYFAWKDDTTYRYHHFRCDGKSFKVPFPLIRCRYRSSRVIYLEKECGDSRYVETLDTYPPDTPLRFIALYSTYDFEGGTFFKYLVSKGSHNAGFIDYDDIDPKQCIYDINDRYWYKNNHRYLPDEGEDAEKLDYNSLWKLFEEQKTGH